MDEYKIYFLGPTGMIARGVWLDCRDDEHALAETRARYTGEAMELWQRERLVETFPVRERGRRSA